MLPLNNPAVISEIAALHDAYELALINNDVSRLGASFWDSPHVVRFGVSEHLYGATAIAAYRNDSPPVLVDRRITRRTITTFGDDMASIMCELTQTVMGTPRHSRQSQLWVRFSGVGWKIVAAHVSHALPSSPSPWANYVDRTAAVLQIPIDSGHRPGVIQNLERAGELASSLLSVNLPSDVEVAPVFVP